MLTRLVFSILAFLFVVEAGAESRSAGALKTELSRGTFRANLKEGFHFNEQAPNSIVIDGKSVSPKRLKGREAEFAGLPSKWTEGRASLYVCDDAVTFCEPHFIELNRSTSASTSTSSAATADTPTAAAPAKGAIDKHGFIEDDFQQALEKAKAQKQLVLIDFAARWCPGCVRFETETFGTAKFKEMTKNFVKVKIDVDKFESGVLSEKFSVKGIPALIVVNIDQEEVDRLVDYQPFAVLEPFFKAVREDATPLKKLMETAKPEDSALNHRIGQRLFRAGRYQESVDFLSRVKPVPPEMWAAKVHAAESRYSTDPATKPQFIQTLKEALAAEAESSRSLGWRLELVGLLDDKTEIAKIRDEGVVLADRLLKDRFKMKTAMKTELVGEFTGYEPMLVAMTKADLMESSQAPADEITRVWREAAAVGRKLKIPTSATGPSMRYLIILTKAELYSEANGVVTSLLKRDPNNPELEHRRLRVLLGLKKHDEAIDLGNRVLKSSYGRNEYWVAEVLAKAYIGAGQIEEARKLLNQYLGRPDIDWSNLKSSKKTLEELRASLAAQ